MDVVANSDVPHEIVFNIFTRVPPKSLMRFRCVSKSFCSFISQPSFTEAHQKGSSDHLLASFPFSTRETLIVLDQEKENCNQLLAFSSFHYLNEPCFLGLPFLESINGLVCLWNDNEDVAVCNPFTKQHVFLPKPVTENASYKKICCSLGFDPISKKHKVIMAQLACDKTRHWNIFTLGMDLSWRELQCCFKFFPMVHNSVYINGVIYCVNYFEFFECHDHDIAAFDVGEENFRMISFPHGLKLSRHVPFSPTIVEIKGEVVLLDHNNFRSDGKIIMYILMNDRTTWVKMQTIELPLEFEQNVTKFFHYQFTSTPKGEIVLIPSFKINSSYLKLMYTFLFFYNTEKKEWIKFELCGVGERNLMEVRDSSWCNIVETIWSL